MTADLNQIVLFTRVVEAGSFTKAAKVLGLPVSSVSRGIVHLEESLGARLLHRTTRKLSLTEAGRLFFDDAKAAVGALEEAAERVSDSGKEAQGVVRVTVPVDLGDSFLISTLAGFQQQHPGIRVDVELQNRRVDLIQEGFDLALRAGRLEDTSLVGKKVSDSTLSIYASEAYLERKGTPSKFADLAEHDCLCLNGLGSTWTMEGPNGAESVRITGPLIANEIGFLTRAVVEGMGLALLPTRRALMHLQAKIGPKLVPVLPDYKIHGGALWLLWPSSRHIPLRIALLRDHLFAAFQRLNDDCDELERTARAECQLEHRNQALNTRKRRVQAGRG